eukprot:9007532-Prorocentrum_lima.AAC.1
MTSSLVGSEMCIRDSVCGGSLESVDGNRPFFRGVRGVSGTGVGSAPVSYTHLTLPTICSV